MPAPHPLPASDTLPATLARHTPPESLRFASSVRSPLWIPILFLVTLVSSSIFFISLHAPTVGRAASEVPASSDQSSVSSPSELATTRLLWLPEMGDEVAGLDCQKLVTVQNMGHDPSKAVLVTWDAPGTCPPLANGPLKVECSGLIRPGRTWIFIGAQLPAGAQSGLVLSFIARRLSELGLDFSFDDLASDMMCETLFFEVTGDADDYRRFIEAYRSGGDFGGIPQERVWGAPLAVELQRSCEHPIDAGGPRESRLAAIAAWEVERFSNAAGVYRYFAPLAPRPPGVAVASLSIQNVGLECAIAELTVRAHARPTDAERCRFDIGALAPGERQRVDLSSCGAGVGGAAAAWIRGSQPLAILVDVVEDAGMSSYTALPIPPDAAGDIGPSAELPGTRYLAPMAFYEHFGWSSRVHLQNGDRDRPARVRLSVKDRSGRVLTSLNVELPPDAGRVVDLTEIDAMPDSWIGSLLVESLAAEGSGDSDAPPAISVVVESLRRTEDGAVTGSAAYGLPPARLPGAPADQIGAGMIAIPSIVKGDPEAGEPTTEMAIANLVESAGSTDLVFLIYDQNGLSDFICQTLSAESVEYIDLTTWGIMGHGFKGSAIISATGWHHPVLDRGGEMVANPLGLAAVTMLRPPRGNAVLGELPGDGPAAARYGIPIPPSARAGYRPEFSLALCGLDLLPATTPTAWPPAPTLSPAPTRPGGQPTPEPSPTVPPSPSATEDGPRRDPIFLPLLSLPDAP